MERRAVWWTSSCATQLPRARLLLACVLLGCAEVGTGKAVASTGMAWEGQVAGASPRPIDLRLSDEDLPDHRFYGMAISSRGYIAYAKSTTDPPFLRIITARGQTLAAFGGQGDGPGEMRAPTIVGWREQIITVVARPGGVIAEFDSAGRLAREVTTGFNGLILGVADSEFDGVLIAPGETRGTVGWQLVHGDFDQSTSLRSASSWGAMQRLQEIGLVNPNGTVSSSGFGYGRTGSHVVVGNGVEYRGIVVPSAPRDSAWRFARDLGPRFRGPGEVERLLDMQRAASSVQGPNGQPVQPGKLDGVRERLETERMPHFGGPRSLFVDDFGRLWVFGTDHDRTFADVFVREGFVGRLTLDCVLPRNGVSLSGRWLALRCEQESGLEALHVYQLQ